jgi:hypothetical protein
MDNLSIALVAAITAAVVLQALILVALYLAVRKTSVRMEALAEEVKSKTIPTLESAHAMMVELRPKIETIASNLAETTTTVRAQVQRLDATVSDVIDRTRLQVIRADELFGRTLDKVEETTEMMHHTVVSPIRQVSGVLHGVTAGLGFLLNRKRARPREAVGMPQDEMFI